MLVARTRATVGNQKRKTAAQVLCETEPGDKLLFEISIDPNGVESIHGTPSWYSTYAKRINVTNLTIGKSAQFSFNQIKVLFEAFEIIEEEENQ